MAKPVICYNPECNRHVFNKGKFCCPQCRMRFNYVKQRERMGKRVNPKDGNTYKKTHCCQCKRQIWNHRCLYDAANDKEFCNQKCMDRYWETEK